MLLRGCAIVAVAALELNVPEAMGAAAAPPVFEVEIIPEPTGALASGTLHVANNGRAIGWAALTGRTCIWVRDTAGTVSEIKSYPNLSIAANPADDEPQIMGYINDNGDAIFSVGATLTARQCFFKPSAGSLILIEGFDTVAGGINDLGQVAYGRTEGSLNNRPAFIGAPNRGTAVGYWGALSDHRTVTIFDLNAHGQAAGRATTASNVDGNQIAIRYSNTRIVELLRSIDAQASVAEGIADNGWVVGRIGYYNAAAAGGQDWRIAIWKETTPDLIAPISWTLPEGYWPVPRVRAWDINNSGQAVGIIRYVRDTTRSAGVAFDTADFSQAKAFLVQDGQMYDLSSQIAPGSGWNVTAATSITNSGFVSAMGRRSADSTDHAIILRPKAPAGGGDGGGNGGGGDGGNTNGPPKPSKPVLAPATDLGFSATDGVTAAENLVLTGTAEANATVTLWIDGAATKISARSSKTGAYTIKVTKAPIGEHTYAVTSTNKAKQSSSASDALTIIRDASLPATPEPAAIAPEDAAVGKRPGDLATRNPRPAIVGTAGVGNTVLLLKGSQVLASAAVGENGAYVLRPSSPLKAGSTAALKIVQMEPSGAQSKKARDVVISVLK